jgi:hypothetical protein
VKYTRNEEFHQDEDKQGELQTKAVLLIQELERHSMKVIAGVAQFHPRTNRDLPALFNLRTQA